jgi:hypothetical protein
VATEPASTAATPGNPNSPTLSKAGSLNGLTIDVSKLTSDFIELGSASDLDDDSVSVSWEISPSTDLISFDTEFNVIDLSLEKLFQLTENSGPKSFEVQVWAKDGNAEPRTTTYAFKIKVPSLSLSDIGAFYASLINLRLKADALADLAELETPHIPSVEVTRSGVALVNFSEEMRIQPPEKITSQALSVKLIPPQGETLTAEKNFSWVTIEYTPQYLKLQLSFDSPTSISSEGRARRDNLEVMVKNPFMFQASTR